MSSLDICPLDASHNHLYGGWLNDAWEVRFDQAGMLSLLLAWQVLQLANNIFVNGAADEVRSWSDPEMTL